MQIAALSSGYQAFELFGHCWRPSLLSLHVPDHLRLDSNVYCSRELMFMLQTPRMTKLMLNDKIF